MRTAFSIRVFAKAAIKVSIVTYGTALCSVSASAATAGYSSKVAMLPSGIELEASTAKGLTSLTIKPVSGTPELKLALDRDATVAPAAPLVSLQTVGEIPGSAIIFEDAYRSIPGGMSYCQAGKEQFLRVISIAHQIARQTLKLKLASCLDDVELDSPGIEWSQRTGMLKIDWLTGPDGKDQPLDQSYKVDANGSARLLQSGPP